MHRPDGWEKTLREILDRFNVTYMNSDECKLVEAGADAILEYLISKGIKTDKFRTNSRPIYLSNPRKKGWYVFIEEK